MSGNNGITERELCKSIVDKIKSFMSHIINGEVHITKSEREAFSKKVDFSNGSVVTNVTNGTMSPSMKTKLDNIAANANVYEHPIAKDIKPGTYALVTVDKYGHVVLAENGVYIDAIAKDSQLLDGFKSDDFVKSRDGVLLGSPKAPTQAITDSSESIATTRFVKNLLGGDNTDLPGTIYEGIAPPVNKKQFWVNTQNGVLNYFSVTKNAWTPIVGVFDAVNE